MQSTFGYLLSERSKSTNLLGNLGLIQAILISKSKSKRAPERRLHKRRLHACNLLLCDLLSRTLWRSSYVFIPGVSLATLGSVHLRRCSLSGAAQLALIFLVSRLASLLALASSAGITWLCGGSSLRITFREIKVPLKCEILFLMQAQTNQKPSIQNPFVYSTLLLPSRQQHVGQKKIRGRGLHLLEANDLQSSQSWHLRTGYYVFDSWAGIT